MLSSRDIALVNEGIDYCQILKFGYSSSDSFSMRKVEPMEIKNGMLWAWDCDKQATKSFKLDKMNGLILTHETFTPRSF